MALGQPAHKRAVGVDYIANKTGYSTVTIRRWLHPGYLPQPNPPRRNARGGRFLWPKGVIDTWITNNFNL